MRLPTGSHHNTSVAFDERFMLKLFRGVSPGPNPELEIGRALTERDPQPAVAKLAGAIEYRGEAGSQMTIAVLHEYVANTRRRQENDARRTGALLRTRAGT